MEEFDYQWISKNGRWQADMTKEKYCIYGSVMSLTIQNSKYSSQVCFRVSQYNEEFQGSIPKYVITELTEYCKAKLKEK